MSSFWHISLRGTLIVRWRLKVYSMLPHRVLKTKALAKYALQQESKHFTSLFFILLYSTRQFVGSSKKQKKQKLRKELLLFLLLSVFFCRALFEWTCRCFMTTKYKNQMFLLVSSAYFGRQKWYDVFVFCRCCFYCRSVVSFHIKSCAFWPTCVEFTLPQSGTEVVLRNFVLFSSLWHTF